MMTIHRSFYLLDSHADSLIRFRGSLIVTLAQRGVNVTGVTPNAYLERYADHIKALGARVEVVHMQRTGTNPFSDIYYFLRILKLLYMEKPTYVLATTIKPVIYGTLAAWLAGVPHRFVMITGLGSAFTGGATTTRAALKFIVQKLYKIALLRANKVFFQNTDDEALFRQLTLIPLSTPSVVVNGSGVDLETFCAAPLPHGIPRFLLIARLIGEKGVREYAQAARIIKAKNPDVHFLLVGWIDSNPDSLKQTELDAWIASGTLTYLGRLDDVRPAIADCTVFVLPSYREGTPRSVLEAMAMGRPIITTDAPGCRETVVDGDNGFLVPVRAVDALVVAMHRFIDEPALANRMGTRSRTLAEQKYDVHKINAVMINQMGIE